MAHGFKPYFLGKDISELSDHNGKKLVQEMIALAKSGQKGWVDYIWPDPETGELAAKSSYILPLDDQYFVGVGVYQ